MKTLENWHQKQIQAANSHPELRHLDTHTCLSWVECLIRDSVRGFFWLTFGYLI